MKLKSVQKAAVLLALSFSVSFQSAVLFVSPAKAQVEANANDAKAQAASGGDRGDGNANDAKAQAASGGDRGDDADGGGKGSISELLSFFASVKEVFNVVQQFVSGNMVNAFGAAFSSQVIKDALKPTGVLNIFNPNAARKQLKAKVTADNASLGDISGGNQYSRATAEANTLDREITRGGVEAYLGDAGQEQIKKEIEGVDGLVKKSKSAASDARKSQQEAKKLSDDAQGLDVTQDVQKKIAAQNAEAANQAAKISAQLSQQTQILGATRTDALKARADAQLANTNLTNISSTLDSMKKVEDAKVFAMTSSNLAKAYRSGLDKETPGK
jgi:hypothetical protein